MELNVTFLIQLGAFLFTVLMLSNVAFGPVLHTLDERKKRIEGAREEAARLLSSSGSQADTIEKRMAAARSAGQDEMSAMKTQGEKAEAELVAKARTDATRQIEDARAGLQKATETARSQLASQAQQLAEAITQKALGRNA